MTATEWRLTIKDNVISELAQITAGADKASAHMGKLQGKVDHVGSSLSKAGGLGSGFKSLMLGAIGGIAAGLAQPLKDLAGESINAFNEQDQALGQLKATWKSTGGAVGLSIDELKEQAEGLQKTTLFGDEQTEQAQSLLMTFTNVKGEIFKQAIPAIQDMATKMGGDLKGSTMQLGKALQDPIAGISALRRVGVSLTNEQMEGIKKLVSAGKMQEAQMMILNELQKEFGGSAEAAANSGTGFMKQLQNSFGDVMEIIGEGIVSLIKDIKPQLEAFVGIIGSGISWIIAHGTDLKNVFVSLATGISVAAVAYGVIAGGAKVYSFYQGVANKSIMIGQILTGGLTAATNALKKAWIDNPFGIVAAAIGLIAAGLMYAWRTSEGFRSYLYAFFESVKQIFSNIASFFKGLFAPIMDAFQAFKEGRYMDAAKAIGKQAYNLTPMGMAEQLVKSRGFTAGVKEAWNIGLVKGSESFKKSQEKKEDKESPYSAITQPSDTLAETNTDKLKNGLSDVSGGGKAVKNINVIIQRFSDKIEINTATVREGANELVSILEEALIRVLSGAEATIATNGQ
jgi:hypothetical protein